MAAQEVGNGPPAAAAQVREIRARHAHLAYNATAGGGAAFTTICTVSNPPEPAGLFVWGQVLDSSAGLTYQCKFTISQAGVVAATLYDNGTSLVAMFALGAGDTARGMVTFNVI